jgi:hypothetical protein
MLLEWLLRRVVWLLLLGRGLLAIGIRNAVLCFSAQAKSSPEMRFPGYPEGSIWIELDPVHTHPPPASASRLIVRVKADEPIAFYTLNQARSTGAVDSSEGVRLYQPGGYGVVRPREAATCCVPNLAIFPCSCTEEENVRPARLMECDLWGLQHGRLPWVHWL